MFFSSYNRIYLFNDTLNTFLSIGIVQDSDCKQIVGGSPIGIDPSWTCIRGLVRMSASPRSFVCHNDWMTRELGLLHLQKPKLVGSRLTDTDQGLGNPDRNFLYCKVRDFLRHIAPMLWHMLSRLWDDAYKRLQVAAAAGFLSECLRGPSSYVRRHITVNKSWWVRR